MSKCKPLTIPLQPDSMGKLCGFFESVEGLRDGFAVKGYGDYNKAETARRRQSEGFEMGIAPACGDEIFELMTDGEPHPRYKFGYVTQVAKMLDVPKSWRGWKKWDIERFKKRYPELYKKAKGVYEKNKTEFRWANLGEIDGKVVFLDWY